MSVVSKFVYEEPTNQDKVQFSPRIAGAKGYKEDAVAEIRTKLTWMKNNLCKNDDEADNLHPSWFCIPSDDTIERVYCGSLSAEKAYSKLLLDMYSPLCCILGLKMIPDISRHITMTCECLCTITRHSELIWHSIKSTKPHVAGTVD